MYLFGRLLTGDSRIKDLDLGNCKSSSRGSASNCFDIVDSNCRTELYYIGLEIYGIMMPSKESNTPRFITV